MRLVPILLMLLVSVPAWAQEAVEPSAATVETREADAVRIPPPVVPRENEDAPERLLPPEMRKSAFGSREARADRTDDFLYHVLLTAVSTLIAALIWRALD